MKTALLLVFFSLSTQVAAQESITLTTFNLPHYGYFPANSSILPVADHTFTGESVRTIRCAFKSLPYQLTIKVMPWKRAQLTVQKGLADGFFSASENDARDEFAVFSAPIADQRWQWYFKTSSKIKPSQEGFRQEAVIGALNGSLMKTWLNENSYKLGVNAQSSEALLKSLLVGRIDAILANEKVMNSLMHDELNYIESKEHSVRPLGVYFSKAFAKQHPDFLSSFNKQVRQCRKSF